MTMHVKEGMEQEYAEYVANNSKDGYSKAVVDFGESWAKLMEKRIAELGDSFDETKFAEQVDPKALSHKADTDGITGVMYGCAVSALAHCWKYGEALRRWHNLDTQIRDEGERANASGGVLNPAIMEIGGPAQ